MRILFIFTSASISQQGDEIVTNHSTDFLRYIIVNTSSLQGWSIPDAAAPYNILSELKGGTSIDFAAPHGSNPPMDPSSKGVNTVPIFACDHADIICFRNIKTIKSAGVSSKIPRPSLFSGTQRS